MEQQVNNMINESKGVNTNFITFFKENNIEIPLIQRDYVQGSNRQSEKRDAFIDSLYDALTNKDIQCELDFIYGTFRDGAFMPLDGQQRLTTLYLLHWYLLNRCRVESLDEYIDITSGCDISSRVFSYKTRRSSTAFCEKLAKYEPSEFVCEISKSIKNQTWFSEDWLQDPTVLSMLDMLDALALKFGELKSDEIVFVLRRLLSTDAVNFDKLDMQSYELTDSLYVKMNARGKQLTEFENWKAKFILYIEENYESVVYKNADAERAVNFSSLKDYFTHSIEHEWTDLFWTYAVADYLKRKDEYKNKTDEQKLLEPEPSGPLVDSFFMNFYYYVYRVLSFLMGNGVDSDNNSNHGTEATRKAIFKNIDNIGFLFGALDLFVRIGKANTCGIGGFFNELFYLEGRKVDGSVRLFASETTDIFGACITDRASVDEQVLLFCIIRYCMRQGCFTVTDNLKKYVRVCRNLLESITQRLTKDMKIHTNVRLSQLPQYILTIDHLCSVGDVLSLSEFKSGMGDVSTVYQWSRHYPDAALYKLEDSGYTHGNMCSFSRNIPTSDIVQAFDAFRLATDLERVRLLVAFGYQGADFGWCAHGLRRFFGYKDRWDVLFRYKEGAGEMEAAFSAYIKEYLKCHDIKKIISDRLNKLCSRVRSLMGIEVFEYYFLKYDAFANSSLWWVMDECVDAKDIDAHHFFAVAVVDGSADYYDIITLPRFSSNPLLGYHTEPYASAVAQCIRKQNTSIYQAIDYTGKDKNRAKITFNNNNVCLECTSEGWLVSLSGEKDTPSFREFEYADLKALVVLRDGKYYVLEDGKDRIETAVFFVTELYNI